MKPRLVVFALVLAGLTAPAVGQAPEVAAAPAKLSDFSCLIRMMHMSNLASKAAEDSKKDETYRSSALKLEAEARRAAFYYMGRVGPEWFATSRTAEGLAEFKTMGTMPREQLSGEVRQCLDGPRATNEQMIASLKSKPATK